MRALEKKLFIFDYDGTIADTSRLHEKAFKEILSPFNLNFQYDDIAGMKTVEAIKFIMKCNSISLSDQELIDLVSNKQLITKELINTSLKPMYGVNEFLSWGKDKFHFSIASSGSRNNITLGLNKLGLIDMFDPILCSDDVLLAKPSPEIFLKVLSLTGFDKQRSVIFEDSDNGILAAKKSNIDFIDVRLFSFKELLKRINCDEFRF